MTDPYTRAERIAIRQDSGMPEREAIKLTDLELSQRKPDGKEYGRAQLAEAFRVLGRGDRLKEDCGQVVPFGWDSYRGKA